MLLDQIYENLGLRYVVYWVGCPSVRFIQSNELEQYPIASLATVPEQCGNV